MASTATESVATAVAARLGTAGVTTEPGDLQAYGCDRTKVYRPRPCAIAFPRTTEDVVALVAIAREHGVRIVPSGGRTGLAGGAVAEHGELVVSMERMNRIGAVDPVAQTVRVQAGAVTQAVHQACAEHGLTWPVDFASKGSSHIGGNIATNAGGVKVIRYGHTRNWVLGLQVVTASGEVLELGGGLEKNNTGLDLRQLFIGTEGTLGIVTEATLKLHRLPGKLDVVLLAVRDMDAVLDVFRAARQSPFLLTAYEFFTDRCARRVQLHRDITPPVERASHYVLFELENADPDALAAWAEALLERDDIVDGTMAQSAAQAAALWRLREDISESLSSTGLPHKSDVSVAIGDLVAFTRELEALFERRAQRWELCLFGHVGDGNIHINAMKPDDVDTATFVAQAHEADREVFALVEQYRGSVSAEHGVGLLKKPFLGYSRKPEEMALLRAVKQALDPDGLLNPGKIFD